MSVESVMPSNRLILCRPLLLLPSIFPSIKVFSNESVVHIRWPKYWSFSFSISFSIEYSGLISFRIDWFDLTVQGTQESSPALQFKSINYLARSLLFVPTLKSVHNYWRDYSFNYRSLCQEKDVFSFKHDFYVCRSFLSKEQVSFNVLDRKSVV